METGPNVLLYCPPSPQSFLLPTNKSNSNPDICCFSWSEKLNYDKLMDLKFWLKFQVPRSRVEDTPLATETLSLQIPSITDFHL